MSILNKEEFNEKDILEIINSKLEESINIEFKNAQALSNDKNVKKETEKTTTITQKTFDKWQPTKALLASQDNKLFFNTLYNQIKTELQMIFC